LLLGEIKSDEAIKYGFDKLTQGWNQLVDNLAPKQRRKIVLNNCNYRLISVLLILLMMVIAGCAATGPVKPPETIAPPPQEIASSNGWWFARFRLPWPAEEQVNWHLDLLIAHKIVLPALVQYKNEILLWRFHRRAVRDQAGHQFSFIFYAAAQTAHQVFNILRSNELLSQMKSAGMIIEDRFNHTDRITKPRIEDASDPKWPPPIQKSWPYFIMGTSQMWLNLISDAIADLPITDGPTSLQEIEEQYKEANIAVSELWQNKGQHAFLHHLSAMFGYQEIIFYDKRMLKF
jgi:hypothetical protein